MLHSGRDFHASGATFHARFGCYQAGKSVSLGAVKYASPNPTATCTSAADKLQSHMYRFARSGMQQFATFYLRVRHDLLANISQQNKQLDGCATK